MEKREKKPLTCKVIHEPDPLMGWVGWYNPDDACMKGLKAMMEKMPERTRKYFKKHMKPITERKT